MLLDAEALFSDNQEITTAAVSTNVVKMASTEHKMTEVSYGTPIPLLIQVTQDFENVAEVQVDVQTATDEAFTTPKTLCSATLVGALKAGTKFPINYIPKGNLGYMRLNYTPTAEAGKTITAGAITAGIVAGHDNSFQDM